MCRFGVIFAARSSGMRKLSYLPAAVPREPMLYLAFKYSNHKCRHTPINLPNPEPFERPRILATVLWWVHVQSRPHPTPMATCRHGVVHHSLAPSAGPPSVDNRWNSLTVMLPILYPLSSDKRCHDRFWSYRTKCVTAAISPSLFLEQLAE